MQGYSGVINPAVEESVPEMLPQIEEPRFSTDAAKIPQDYVGLKAWWSFFNDPVLNSMVSSALSMNASQMSQAEDFPADDMTKDALKVFYKDKRVNLVNAIASDYVEYRYIQTQAALLNEYIAFQENELLHVPMDDEEEINNELEFLNKRKEEFTSRLRDVSVSLSKTTQLLPEYIDEVLKNNQGIPKYDITPLMASSAHIITNAADIDAVRSLLSYKSRGQAGLQDTRNILLDIPINQLFGISENIFVNTDSSWRVKIGNARQQVSYTPVRARLSNEDQVQMFVNSVNAYITEIESLLVSIATLRDQEEVLEKAVRNATQKELYKARLAVLRAEYEKTKTIVKLFERLDLY